ncbi:phosphate/phosphite/phosphonate ABC transporter substrate-binding protein [Pseudoduganella umbonata]|uniref:ABC-type phosphate/phosphonate transport system substrate-binding protein n=1 Tax=Pseudoduganella umbonata TaxID=864828 RepID=A0A4P8HJI7_9BURK|nr:PhnD/SsuA/transferrin family substrate-binding protein [Pseudoduganella umbonata]MBB3219849.1 ABC-type phosphate/phosphonate transport system substrate-binding protein [Pseudoduganella umbonata]QCP09879.1 phosphate ABC transporter substrate-binding protein [Pseudoduganella umbonata]
MTWKAALPMYNVSPRLRQGYDALLEALLADAGVTGAVELVDDTGPLLDFWQRPDLLFAQTCGYPWLHALRGHATLVATPAFDVPGCDGSDYSSVLVVRGDGGIRTLDDARGRVAAVNERHSNSGMNALRHAVAPLARDGRFFGRVEWSGSHAASVRLVRDSAADVASIDCVTWAYLREEDPASVEGLVPLGFTAASPGLPFIAGKSVPDAVLRRLRAVLLDPGSRLRQAMAPLRIRGFAHRDERDYARIGHLEEHAASLGYPALR